MYCTAEFCDLYPNEVTMSVTDSSSIAFRYGLDHGDYFVDAERPTSPFQISLPDIDQTIIGPEIINTLEITILHRAAPETPYQILKYALTNCSHLQLFNLGCLETSQKNCASADVPRLHETNRMCDPFITLQQNLTKVELEGVVLSNDMLNLLRNCLPHLEYLFYLNLHCRRYYYDAIEDSSGSSMIYDMTGLRSLNTFYLDVQTINYGAEFIHVFIHFKYTNSEEESYYDIKPNPEKNKWRDQFICTTTTLDVIEERHLSPFVVSFDFSNKIKEIFISHKMHVIGYLVDGQQKTFVPSNQDNILVKITV